MNPAIVALTALHALTANRLRAGLALLGIVIGVASVIAVVALGRGAQESITSFIEDLGTNMLTVQPGGSEEGLFFRGFGTAKSLTLDDAAFLEDKVFAPAVGLVAPEINFWGQASALQNNMPIQGVGVTSEYLEVRNFTLASGRNISPADVINRTEVVVIGSRVAQTLYGARDPVGAAVRIDGREFTVVGVLASKGDEESGFFFGFGNDTVLAPITTAHYRLNFDRSSGGGVAVDTIYLQAVDETSVDAAASQIETALRLQHELGPTDENDFTITNQAEVLAALENTGQVFVIFLGGIAGVSLLVGGIGIMNIMLVSVTERTREIGIRRAVGAKQRDILLQFVLEAVLLTLGGGLIGIAAGIGIASLMNNFDLGGEQLTTVVSANTALLALGVSVGIGLIFGISPAIRAARLNPIEALRYQ